MRWPEQWQRVRSLLLRWRDRFEAPVNSLLELPAKAGLRTTTAIAVGLAMFASGLVACTLQLAVGDSGRPGQPGSGASASTPPTVNPSHRVGARERGEGFTHPGVLVSQQQLDFVRDRLDRGMEPWSRAFAEMASSPYASLSWQPRPRAVVECGGFSIPDLGCRDETADALAAYTHALMWYLTRRVEHAQKAVQIIDAWSGVLQQHTNSNAQIQAGWAGATLVRTAELVRHTYEDWPADRIAQAETMFRTAFLPQVGAGAPTKNGNWEFITLDAAIGIAVFLDDRPLLDRVIARFRARVPAFVYLAGDGPLPRNPTGGTDSEAATVSTWYGQRRFVDGVAQETCRDFGHTGWGLSAMAHVAETARLQRVDLYGEIRPRIIAALEFHLQFENGQQVPGWLCGGTVQRGLSPSPEVAYHQFAVRMGIPMPNTERFLQSKRPQGAAHFFAWETLTHANNAY